MAAVNIVSFLILCLAIAGFAYAENYDSGQLLKRIERLEYEQRKTQSKVHILERKVSSQSMVIESQAAQIKSLQKEAQRDRKLVERVNRVVRSNDKNINVLRKILTSSTSYILPNDMNRGSDTNLAEARTENSKVSTNPSIGGIQQKKPELTQKRTTFSNGRFLEKRQERAGISFSVYVDHDVDLGAHQTIKFNKVIINDGNGYNIHSGLFTCPEAGVYMFSFFIGERSETSSTSGIYGELMINSVNTVDAVVDTFHQYQDLQGGNTVIKRLKQGDVVWVAAMGNGHHAEGGSGLRITTFSGVYLYP